VLAGREVILRKDYRMCTATEISGWMGYQTRLKGEPIFGGYICGKWGIATFWRKSVVHEKIVSSPSGVLLISVVTSPPGGDRSEYIVESD